MPLIYIMSWRSCRRFGQAFSETASWVLGYLIGTGILLALHFGGVGLISATPDDPAAIFAVIGGFVGMGISRYLWKRRGGHLEPVNNPLTNNRWYRIARAMITPSKGKGKTRRQSSPKRNTTTSTTAVPNRGSANSQPTPSRAATTTGKTSAQRWGRVLGAMMTPSDSQRRPPR